MFAEELRGAIVRAPRLTLPQVTALLWRAYGEGQITEAEAESLSALIELRRAAGGRPAAGQSPSSTDSAGPAAGEPTPDRQSYAGRSRAGARPRTDASLARRRRWAASGRLPPGLAARFTLAEQAVLALVAAEVTRRKDCRLAIEHMAAVAGVCRSTVKSAIREAVRLGLLTLEERRVTGFRNDTNVLRVVSPEWVAWLRLARRAAFSFARVDRYGPSSRGGGVKSVTGTPTQVLESEATRPAEPQKGCRKAAGDLPCGGGLRIRAGGGTPGGMQ